MATVLAPSRTTALAPPAVLTLDPDDVSALRLSGERSNQAMRDALRRHPGRSVWAPATLEFALLSPWRHRKEISHVEELTAVRHTEPLLRAAFERCVDAGDELMLVIDLDTYAGPTRFERAGLDLLEEVITYELNGGGPVWRVARGLRLAPVPNRASAIDQLLELDHAAFPWLWQNSRAEFDVYLDVPGVEVFLLVADDEVIGYVGLTMFAGWGHLDRIAIAPEHQGRGFGREALGQAIDHLRRRGARRVCLSTQRTNWRSQRLYQRFGFRRTPDHDYWLFGAWCRPGLERRIS
jgi:ribosomal protein S18 acetylase RimI-like enzyme